MEEQSISVLHVIHYIISLANWHITRYSLHYIIILAFIPHMNLFFPGSSFFTEARSEETRYRMSFILYFLLKRKAFFSHYAAAHPQKKQCAPCLLQQYDSERDDKRKQ